MQVCAAEALVQCKRLAFEGGDTTAAARQEHLVQMHLSIAERHLRSSSGSAAAPGLCDAWALLEQASELLEGATDRPENANTIWCKAAMEQARPLASLSYLNTLCKAVSWTVPSCRMLRS